MKFLFVILAVTTSVQSYAQDRVSARPTSSTTGRAYEVVIEGETARKLYEALDGKIQRVQSGSRVWVNKNSNGILCGKIENRKEYACSLVVDQSGVLQ